MRRFAQGIASRSSKVPLSSIAGVARQQTGAPSSSPFNPDETVFTAFPNEAREAAPTQTRDLDEVSHSQRGARRHHKSEADGLLRDIFDLEKQVAAEQQRQRLSVRASQLGLTTPPLNRRRAGRSAVHTTPAEPHGREEQACETTALSPPPPPPVLSVPTAEETARAASRARQLGDDDVSVFAKPTSTNTTTTTATAASSSPAMPSSWAPPFTVTSDLLRSSLEGPASEVAFTLEELENTLFTPAADEEERGEAVEAEAVEASAQAPPSPPTSSADIHGSVPAAASSTAVAEPAKAEKAAAEAASTTTTPLSRSALPSATAIHLAKPVETNKSSESAATASSTRAPSAKPPCAFTLPPLLKCRLRGATVVVTATRRATHLSELVEALHDAVTFAESLPAAPSGVMREVRLRSDTAASSPAATQQPAPTDAFLSVEDALEELTATAEERVRVQLLKDSLLRRIQDGARRGLRYVAEIHAESTAGPAELRNVAAELVVACGRHEVHHAARLSKRLDKAGQDPVRLSFSGIGSGVFPAPATVMKVAALLEHLLEHDAQRASLMRSLGCKADEERAEDELADVVCGTMLCLHLLPVGVSTALLATACPEPAAVAAKRGTVKQWWATLSQLLAQQWTAVRRSLAASGFLGNAATADVMTPLSACNTASQVWLWTCQALLRRQVAEDVAVVDIVSSGMRSAPLQRCRRSLALAGASLSPQSLPSREGSATPTSPAGPPLSPLVMEVSHRTLAQTSVTDLASEVREQPADVLLAVDADVPLQQRLKFLASLHLTDTGSHHRVTVLLSGPAQEVAECASLTRSSGSLLAAQRAVGYGSASTDVDLCDPAWLQQVVEVSAMRPSTEERSSNERTVPEVDAAAHFVATRWRRPCIVTATSQVSAALSAAASPQTGKRGAAASSPTAAAASLSPLVLLHRDAAGMVAGAGALRNASAPQPSATAERKLQLGVTFLMVLDAACGALCREQGSLSPAAVNVLSIAALQLDASAGGVLDAADRVCGEDVAAVVTAMEAAAVQQPSLTFSSLPLLRWMAEERVLFYQLNGNALARFVKSQARK